jgi:hypothetical protein
MVAPEALGRARRYPGRRPGMSRVGPSYLARGTNSSYPGKMPPPLRFMDTPAGVQDRIPGELMRKDGILQFYTEEEGYLPEGHFSKDAFLHGMEAAAKGTLSEGYERLWLIGDTTVVIRNSIDLKAWFATESVSEFAPRYPQFIMCLYNLDLYDGETLCTCLGLIPGSSSMD